MGRRPARRRPAWPCRGLCRASNFCAAGRGAGLARSGRRARSKNTCSLTHAPVATRALPLARNGFSDMAKEDFPRSILPVADAPFVGRARMLASPARWFACRPPFALGRLLLPSVKHAWPGGASSVACAASSARRAPSVSAPASVSLPRPPSIPPSVRAAAHALPPARCWPFP